MTDPNVEIIRTKSGAIIVIILLFLTRFRKNEEKDHIIELNSKLDKKLERMTD
mgnify:CR=1 FL=1